MAAEINQQNKWEQEVGKITEDEVRKKNYPHNRPSRPTGL
jgi:hypothetical protein